MRFQECKKCVMDTTDPEITFSDGICNHCLAYDRNEKLRQEDLKNFDKYIEQIKEDGKGKKYDVLLGMSGGVDSSLCLHYLVNKGLRPFCFTIDNGWNTPESDENILLMVEKLRVPFFRYTIDLNRFAELQSAFFQSGTANVEIPTDHILAAASYELCDKYEIKWIISGGNLATENTMPRAWGYQPSDLVFIKDIFRRFGKGKLTGMPLMGWFKYNWFKWIVGIKSLYLLDFYDYNREKAIKLLSNEYGWKPYGDKHEESVFTAWFQNYYLFEKFGYDKRKAHYSSLIHSGQMTRAEAIELLSRAPIYPKLGLELKVMKYPKRTYKDYRNSEWLWNLTSAIIRNIRKWKF